MATDSWPTHCHRFPSEIAFRLAKPRHPPRLRVNRSSINPMYMFLFRLRSQPAQEIVSVLRLQTRFITFSTVFSDFHPQFVSAMFTALLRFTKWEGLSSVVSLCKSRNIITSVHAVSGRTPASNPIYGYRNGQLQSGDHDWRLCQAASLSEELSFVFCHCNTVTQRRKRWRSPWKRTPAVPLTDQPSRILGLKKVKHLRTARQSNSPRLSFSWSTPCGKR